MASSARQADKYERTIETLRQDIEQHCETCMYVQDKSGKKVALRFNRAQRYIHAKIEEQRERTGKVRAIILKGRQQGASTYIGARFYCISSINYGRNAFIVAHEQKATDNLFKMVKRYHQHNVFAPSTSATNSKELVFNRLDGGYKLATAGSKDVGRSNTAQLLHASEFAFWDNAITHMAGLGNAISDMDGTEIIIESTANGVGGPFHQMWQDAEAGNGEYIAIFVPWFWQEEYTAVVPVGFELSAEDAKYKDTYGLDMGQMAWRANKITVYGQSMAWLFDQEYPATAALAFKSATTDPLINPTDVMAAINSGYRAMTGPLIIGCDPAEYGPDRTAIAFRRGRVVFRLEVYEKKGPMEVAGILAAHWKKYQPDGMLVDKIGIGSGIVDRLKELNIPVIGVNSASKAEDSETYANKRAEMWYRMKEWVEDQPCTMPPNPALVADMSAPKYKTSSNGRKLVESKDEMKARQVRSPDLADAIALTFAEHIAPMSAVTESRGAQQDYRAPTSAGY